MSTRPVTVYVPVCDLCGAEGQWSATPEDAVRWAYEWTRRGNRIACPQCSEDQRWADCAATFGEHAWIEWEHHGIDGVTGKFPFTFWVTEKDGKPRWRMRRCGVCRYSEHQDEGGQWTSYREMEGA